MTEINYELLAELQEKPHPLLHIAEDFHAQLTETPEAWTGEVFQEARTAHHLLDMIKIPQRDKDHVYASDLDSRTYLAITEVMALRERLARIAGWHSRETAPGGMVGDCCNECGQPWPCDTRRMAEGTYVDDQPGDGSGT